MLAQRRKQWANVGSALGQSLVFDRPRDRKRLTKMNGTLIDTDNIERTQVKQHVPSSVYQGET